MSNESPKKKKINGALIIAFCALIVSVVSAYFTYDSNQVTKNLASISLVPRLQIRPVKFYYNLPKSTFGTTIIEINNISNFTAYKVNYDLKYHSDWINLWNETRVKELESKASKRTKNEDEELKLRKSVIGKGAILKPNDLVYTSINGQCLVNLCDLTKKNKEYPVHLKVSWSDEKARYFEREIKCGLKCVRVGDAENFFFSTCETISKQ